MATWKDIAAQNRTAAVDLFGLRRWRACVNRAYYAVYSQVTHGLTQVPIPMPAGRQAPAHLRLPVIVGENLTSLRPRERWRLAGLVKRSYDLRCNADYRRDPDMVAADARIALSLMEKGV